MNPHIPATRIRLNESESDGGPALPREPHGRQRIVRVGNNAEGQTNDCCVRESEVEMGWWDCNDWQDSGDCLDGIY